MKKAPAKIGFSVAEAIKDERLRISRELHDRVLQPLSSVKMRAETCRRQLFHDQAAVQAELQHIEETIDRAITEIRNLLTENQSPEELQAGSLERRLKQELDIFSTRSGFKLDFHCSIGGDNLPVEVEKELYFTLREGILNAVRHSRATELHLSLKTTPDGYEAALRDNGVGFDPAAAAGSSHYGLRGMRQRMRRIGGDLTVDSAAGKGTHIRITVPFEAGKNTY